MLRKLTLTAVALSLVACAPSTPAQDSSTTPAASTAAAEMRPADVAFAAGLPDPGDNVSAEVIDALVAYKSALDSYYDFGEKFKADPSGFDLAAEKARHEKEVADAQASLDALAANLSGDERAYVDQVSLDLGNLLDQIAENIAAGEKKA